MEFLCKRCRSKLDLYYDPNYGDTKTNITKLLIAPCQKCQKKVGEECFEAGERFEATQNFARTTGQEMGR